MTNIIIENEPFDNQEAKWVYEKAIFALSHAGIKFKVDQFGNPDDGFITKITLEKEQVLDLTFDW